MEALSDPDMMLVHVIMPKAEEVAAPADAAAVRRPRPRRRSPRSSRRARRTRPRTRRTRSRSSAGLRGPGERGHEAGRRARQSGPEVSRNAAQHRVCRGRRAGEARRRRHSSAAPVDALIAKWRSARHAHRQADDVHEPERPGDRRAPAVLQDRPAGSARHRRRSAAAAGEAAGAGREGRPAGTTG